MEQTIGKIKADLQALGVKNGDNLLVHSSLRSLGKVEGGAETVIRGMLEALGGEGTLLFPALSYVAVNAANPVFDVCNTPSCVGALPEYFRTRPGTVRSLHPTHSMSGIGKNTAELFGDHWRSTTSCGEFSPFRKLRDLGGWVLFLGCSTHPNTMMHAVEELVDPPYLHTDPVDYRIIREDGSAITMRVRRHNFKGYRQRYDRLCALLKDDEIRRGKVLEADCTLLNIPAIWREGLAALQKDPFFFVEEC